MAARADRPFEAYTDLALKGVTCPACIFGVHKYGPDHIPGCRNDPRQNCASAETARLADDGCPHHE